MKKVVLAITVLCLMLSLWGCAQGQGDTDVGEVEMDYGSAHELIPYEEMPLLDGSTANLPLGRALLQYYCGLSADEAEVRTIFSTTDPAYYALLNGEVDLLLVYEASRDTQEYIDFSEFEFREIGYDALVFLANEGNSVNGLGEDQIKGIYSGAITNWSEVGGADAPIIPYQRNEDSGSQTLMRKLVLDAGLMDAPRELRPGGMGGLMEEIAAYENDNGAIGYSVYYYARNMYALPGVKLLEVDGVAPSNQSISDGSYPYVNPFYAVIRKNEPDGGNTRMVFDFLTSPEGQELVEKAGYVPVG